MNLKIVQMNLKMVQMNMKICYATSRGFPKDLKIK